MWKRLQIIQSHPSQHRRGIFCNRVQPPIAMAKTPRDVTSVIRDHAANRVAKEDQLIAEAEKRLKQLGPCRLRLTRIVMPTLIRIASEINQQEGYTAKVSDLPEALLVELKFSFSRVQAGADGSLVTARLRFTCTEVGIRVQREITPKVGAHSAFRPPLTDIQTVDQVSSEWIEKLTVNFIHRVLNANP